MNYAAQELKLEKLHVLLNTGVVDPNQRNSFGATALYLIGSHVSSEERRKVERALHLLIDAGADASLCTYQGVPPLHNIAMNANIKILESLLKRGVDPNLTMTNELNSLCTVLDTLLAESSDTNDEKINLVQKYGGKTNTAIWLVIKYKHYDTAVKRSEALPNALNQQVTLPNMAKQDQQLMCLLDKPFSIAKEELAQMLQQWDIPINNMYSGTTLLHKCIMQKYVELAKEIITCYQPNLAQLIMSHTRNNPDHKQAAIHLAITYKQHEVLECLLQHSADVNLVNGSQRTALHLAAQQGDEIAVTLLLQHGADTTLKDVNGKTACNLAMKAKHINIVTLLIQHARQKQANQLPPSIVPSTSSLTC